MSLPASICWSGRPYRLLWILPKIWTQPNGREFGIYQSADARHGILFPEPTNAELSKFYNIPEYNNYLSGSDNRSVSPSLLDRIMIKFAYLADRSISDPIPTILKLATDQPTVCDIGCGSGAFLEHIRSAGATYVMGVDPSEVSSASTKSKNIEFYLGTAEQMPMDISDQRFDIVTMFQSLEHCRNPLLALSNARDLLKPGGLLCVDVPNMACFGAILYKQAWFHCDAGRHLQFFTPESLAALCESVGLEIVKTEYAGFAGQFTPLWINAMQQCWDSLFEGYEGMKPPRASRLLSFSYLLASIASTKRRKYDIVRVYAHI